MASLVASNTWEFCDAPRLTPVARASALELMAYPMAADLAYGADLRPRSEADALARELADAVGEPADWWSNTDGRPGLAGRQWAGFTATTFDLGVVGLSASRQMVLWFTDED